MKNRIRIIADNKIPFLKGALEPVADIEYLSPDKIIKDVVKDKDALMTRTRTYCNSDLLDGSKIKFIATATIGFDHIDTEYCASKNIKWVNAPGCNSTSVMQYISSALLTIAKKNDFRLSDKTIGVVGVGNVGSKVAGAAEILGMKVLLNDPPRERIEGKEKFVSLDKIISESDIITFHVPLIKEGIDKTYHLADENFFNKLKRKIVLLNTSRGSVVKTSALKDAILKEKVTHSVLDVWENEPDIDLALLNMVDIATPHIAGYSADGKANGTSVCIRELSKFFNLGIDRNWYPDKLPAPKNSEHISIDCNNKSDQDIFYEAVNHSYDILKDDNTLRNSAETFEKQRGNYPVRREFPYYSIKTDCRNEIKEKLSKLGFNII